MGSKNLKIVLAVNHYAPMIGGCEVVCRQIAEHLSQRHQLTVVTRRVKARNRADFKSYDVIEYIPGDQHRFMAVINKIAPDVVLVYSDVFDFFRQLVSYKDKKFRLLVALCGANWINSNRSYANIFVRNSVGIDKIICHSTLDRDYRFCTSSRLIKKTVVIPNGIDLNEFDNNDQSRSDLIEKHKLDPAVAGKKWVLSVSNFFPGKGQCHMFPILEQVHGDYVYLQICTEVGFSIGRELEMKWSVQSHKCKGKAVLLKNIPREDVVAFFKQSSIFAFTSEKEVAPIVLLESMAAGTPWIATEVGNAAELEGGKVIRAVKDQSGYSIFDGRVYRLFAQGLESIWGRTAVAEPGRLQVERTFNWDKILPQYASIVEN